MPRILHELFTHHYNKSEVVEWNDSEEQRKSIAKKMKDEKVWPSFTHEKVKGKTIKKWDVTTSCAALKVVVKDSLLQLVQDVKDSRNTLSHLTEAKVQRDKFKEIKDCVQKLIRGAGSSIPKAICDDCQKDLETSSELQFVVACESHTVYTTTSKPLEQQLLHIIALTIALHSSATQITQKPLNNEVTSFGNHGVNGSAFSRSCVPTLVVKRNLPL